MDRRKFLIAPIVLAGLSLHKDAQAKVASVAALKKLIRPDEIQLGGQDSFMAMAGKTFILPKNPLHGEKYYFSVDSFSLENPCKITSHQHKVVGDSELVLNCLAIFSLTFNAVKGEWELT